MTTTSTLHRSKRGVSSAGRARAKPRCAQPARLDEEDVDKDHTDDAGDREEHTERAARGRRRELAKTGGGRAGWLVVIPTPSILLSMPRKGKLNDVPHMEF